MIKADMVCAYVESLLEQLLDIERIRPDKDGDYPVRHESALYFVRIVPGRYDDPVVQVFAIALAGITPSPKLFDQLNEINTQLHFSRTFWVGDQVLIEAEMHWESLSAAGFSRACHDVAHAADYFGPQLAETFGGRTAFDDQKDPDYKEPAVLTGQWQYL